MNLYKYNYIKIPSLTGDIKKDIKEMFLVNKREETYNHVNAVAKINKKIAEKYNLDEEKCVVSALLHDISTILLPEDMLNYAKEKNYNLCTAEEKYPFLLHQRISKTIAKEVFEINDLDILSAIECHTTLKSNPTKYDMALFIADKLSWDQDGVPPFYNSLRSALEISLEKASLVYIEFVIENGMILYPHPWLLEARSFLTEFI